MPQAAVQTCSERKFGLGMMKSLSKTTRVAAALLFTIPAVWLAARAASRFPAAPQASSSQSPSPPLSEAQTKIIVNSSLVVLPVTVKDGAGRLVPDLQRNEFRVFEDDVEQNIDVFTAEAFPLSMVVLIDNDLKSRDAKQVEGSLDAIVGAMSNSDEAFVCRFDEYFHEGKGFTNDQDKLLTELQRTHLDSQPSVAPQGSPSNEPTINGHSVTGGPSIARATMALKGQSTKALDDAVFSAAQLLKDRGRNRRRIIFLVSDGQNGGKKANTNSYDNTVKELLSHGISVFGVGVGSAIFDRRFERLSKYAHDTGGDVYYAAKQNAMAELYSRVTEEARNEYTLAYMPRNTDRAKEYHSVEVRVRREGLSILTRGGYYSGPVSR